MFHHHIHLAKSSHSFTVYVDLLNMADVQKATQHLNSCEHTHARTHTDTFPITLVLRVSQSHTPRSWLASSSLYLRHFGIRVRQRDLNVAEAHSRAGRRLQQQDSLLEDQLKFLPEPRLLSCLLQWTWLMKSSSKRRPPQSCVTVWQAPPECRVSPCSLI